jgi:hypothetical protein
MRYLPLTVLLAVVSCAPSATTSTEPDLDRDLVVVDLPHGGSMMLELYRNAGVTIGWIAAPPEDVWPHLRVVYAEVGLGPDVLSLHDPETMRIGVRNHRTRRLAGERLSHFLRCGQGLGAPKADNGQTRIGLTSWLEADAGGTLIRVRLEGSAREIGTSTAAVTCSTTGELERRLVEAVVARAGSADST